MNWLKTHMQIIEQFCPVKIVVTVLDAKVRIVQNYVTAVSLPDVNGRSNMFHVVHPCNPLATPPTHKSLC